MAITEFNRNTFMDRRLSEEEGEEQPTVINQIVLKECRKAMSSFFPNSCFQTGLAYRKLSHIDDINIDYWGCPNCDIKEDGPTGYTKCFYDLPLLCHYHGNLSRARYEVKNPNTRYGWSEGYVKKGPSFMGCVISSKQIGDLVCQESFGSGWRMATSKQGMIIDGMMGFDFVGEKWKVNGPKKQVSYRFWAHGNVDDEGKSFWVSNESGNNCFQSVAPSGYWE